MQLGIFGSGCYDPRLASPACAAPRLSPLRDTGAKPSRPRVSHQPANPNPSPVPQPQRCRHASRPGRREPRPQPLPNPSAPYKSEAASPQTLEAPASLPPPPHEEEEEEEPELRKEEKADAPELHQAGAPYDDPNAADLPARPRPTGSNPPPHRAPSPSAPPDPSARS
ncbi:predicted GPI-anchored protein 58 [Panicum hallii]|uniref:predicted GPI-anchored protein 58 n=1 Tax=Panicum hallii TaxID=206008 RepID=UPI000DF4DBDD|nr:predicted GPI-anchored protein 58 [Panicum hallii]